MFSFHYLVTSPSRAANTLQIEEHTVWHEIFVGFWDIFTLHSKRLRKQVVASKYASR